jgi:uncharacterized protein YaaR (DUF327 family)
MAKISRSGIGNKGLNSSLKSNNSANNTNVNKSPKNTHIDINHSPFTDALNEVEINFEKEELAKTLDEIKDLGNRLCKNPNIELLEKYKKQVKEFLNEALKRIYKVDSKEGLKKPGQEQKVYLYVEEIDNALKELANQFLSEQNEALNIINTVEGIQGLLYNVVA